MIKATALPEEFEQYERIEFCGNTLVNTPLIFTMGDHVPILIGKGKHAPLVWVSLPVDKDVGNWASLITKNRSLNPAIEVLVLGNTTEVKVGSVKVISAAQSNDHATVSAMDLTPLGFSINGDSTSLRVGSNTMSKNTVSNSRAFVGLA